MGWTRPDLNSASSCQLAACGVVSAQIGRSFEMNTTTAAPVVGVDLAKNVFERAVAGPDWRITERARLYRS